MQENAHLLFSTQYERTGEQEHSSLRCHIFIINILTERKLCNHFRTDFSFSISNFRIRYAHKHNLSFKVQTQL